MKKSIACAMASAVLLLAACSGGGEEKAAEGGEAPAAGAEAKPAEAPAAAAAGATGVAECDEMYAKVEACLKDKVPAAQKGAMEAGFQQSKDAISKITDKAKMAEMCKTTMEQSKAAYSAMGCAM
jgi:hypothetical protein